jgi:23S rRNA (cytosine1962-C5)-methyltransferase
MSTQYPVIYLKSDKQMALARHHPWIFSGGIDVRKSKLHADLNGQVVCVQDSKGAFLGLGHYSFGTSIAVRMLSRVDQHIDAQLWENRLENALNLRKKVIQSDTTGFRWIHGEGDLLPGLIIDIYGRHVVIQTHTHGMFLSLEAIGKAVDVILRDKVDTIYARRSDGGGEEGFWIKGNAMHGDFLENGLHVVADWHRGQKTGYFLDQRYNRQLAGSYAHGLRVLDLFCNMGGFSLHCLKHGAAQVTAVDSSRKALEHALHNVGRNFGQQSPFTNVESDCLTYLQKSTNQFDLVICDPPAFAKSLSKRHNAVQGYKRLNVAAMKAVEQGGLLFTFSCSQVVDELLFYNTIVAAGIESGRSVRVLHKLTQGPDHPVNLFHKEGSYLKGLVLSIS